MRDGTRYRIVNGAVTTIRDRNGNYIERNPTNSNQYIDSLKRTTTLALTTQSTGCDVLTFYGYNNAMRQVKVWYSPLANILRPGFTLKTGAELFPELYGNNPYPYNYASWTHNPTLVSKVELPDGRTYEFRYDSYGTVARVILPTGGGYDYEYKGCGDIIPGSNPPTQGSFWAWTMYYRRLSKRTVFNTLTATTSPTAPPAGTVEGYTLYSDLYSSATYPMSATCLALSKYDASNALLAHEKHYFCSYPTANIDLAPTQYSSWSQGKEHKAEYYAVTGGAIGSLLRKTEQTWNPSLSASASAFLPPPNPKLTEIMTTLSDTAQTAKVSYLNPTTGAICYDQYNNPTDVWEYDYGATTPSRTTHFEYQTSGYDTVVGGMYAPDPLNTIHLRSLVTLQRVSKVVGTTTTTQAETSYEYDNYTPDAGNLHATLTARSNITCLDAVYANTIVNVRMQRGNVTMVSRWLNTGSPVQNWMQYDVAGNVVKATDARSTTSNMIATSIDYDDRFGAPDGDARANSAPTEVGTQMTYAFPTKVTNAAGHCTYQQFDYQSGKPVDFEDANQIKYSSYYADPLDRLTEVRKAVGVTAVTTKSRIYYADVVSNVQVRRVTVIGDFNAFGESDNETSGTGLKSIRYYDGLGRTYRSSTCEGSTWAIAATEFDGLGRIKRVTNPFRGTAADAALPATPEWTTTAYDGLSRAISVVSPDGATVTTAFNGPKVKVTDQDNKQRLSETDGLGRLCKVWEVTSAGSTVVNFNGTNQNSHLTQYTYDALDNLCTVTQGVQTRTFVYDSLKRLSSATNPESGTTTYVYDANGNLCEKTDARTTKTTFTYDVLNRATQKTYSGATTEGINAANTTPVVCYKYDGQALPSGAPVGFNRGFAIGRLVAVTYGGTTASTGSYYGYDELGRAVRRTQQIDSNNYAVQATYNRASAMMGETYPSAQTVSYGYDLTGRLTSFSGTLGTGATTTYASVTQFNAASQIERETYGMSTPLYLKQAYNNRLQLVDTRLGTVNDATNWNRGRLSLLYGNAVVTTANTRDSASTPAAQDLTVADLQGNSTDNNGNIKRMYHFVPTGTDASQQVNAYVIPQRDDYTYDALNRSSSVTECQRQVNGGALVTGVAGQNYGYDQYGNRTITGVTGPVNGWVLAFNTASNRISTANYGYDSVGNLINENGASRTYDAENRMVSASGGTYVYDGEGKRVKRTASGQTWCYVYGIGGELLSEYLSTTPTTASKQYGYKGGKLLVTTEGTTLKWLVTDHLGSTRLELNAAGAVATRHDYLPFGEELFAGIRGSGQNGYEPPVSTTRQRFGGYERDNESGLDFAGARYFANVQGRFTSADPVFFQKGMLVDPQRYNLYAYARNNPLRFVDPKGEAIELIGDDEKRKKILEALREAVGKQAGAYLYENKVTGKDGKTRYYVGIKTGGKTDFSSVNAVAKDIGAIINDTKVASIQIVSQGTRIGNTVVSSNPDLCKCDAVAIGVAQPGPDANHVLISLPLPSPGDAYDRAGFETTLPVEMRPPRPGYNDAGIDVAHELGHARALLSGAAAGSLQSDRSSLDLENKVRFLRDPAAPTREYHGERRALRGEK